MSMILRLTLNSRDTRHLAACLDRHDQNHAADVRPASEEVEIGNLLARVLLSYLGLDKVILGKNVWVVSVAVGMQLRQCL